MVKDGKLNLNTEDEIIRDTLVAREGKVVHEKVRESLGLSSDTSRERSEK
jgi:hypothetical protein